MNCYSIEKNKNSCDDYDYNDFEEHFFHFSNLHYFIDTLEVKKVQFIFHVFSLVLLLKQKEVFEFFFYDHYFFKKVLKIKRGYGVPPLK